MVLLLPEEWGVRLLGDTWSVAEPLLPVIGAQYLAIAAGASAMAGLRTGGEAALALRVRIGASMVTVLLVAIAAFGSGDAIMVAVGVLVGDLVCVVASWGSLIAVHYRQGESEKSQ